MKNKKVIALLMAAAMLVSCGKVPEETTERTTEETTTTTTAEETTEETTRTTIATTAYRPTATPTPTPVPEPPADPIDADEDQYGIFMAQIDAIETEYPGGVYRIDRSYSDGYYWILVSIADHVERKYVIKNGEIEMISEESLEEEDSFGLTYDTIKRLPLLLETDEYSFGLLFDGVADTLDNGRYFGSVLGVSQDGTRLLLLVGRPMELDRSFVESLNEGDSIGYSDYTGDITVTSIDDYGSGRLYHLSNGHHLSSNYCEDEDTYMVASDNDCPYVGSVTLAEVPVSPSCAVTDTFDMLYGMSDEYDPDAPSDNPITGSYWWYMGINGNEYAQFPAASNGWYMCNALAYPVVIQNGQAVSVNLEWR